MFLRVSPRLRHPGELKKFFPVPKYTRNLNGEKGKKYGADFVSRYAMSFGHGDRAETFAPPGGPELTVCT